MPENQSASMRMSLLLLSFVLIMALSGQEGVTATAPADLTYGAGGVRFASPLQSLTIWDRKHEADGPRSQFLTKYRAGLNAEAETRKEVSSKQQEYFPTSSEESGSKRWAKNAAEAERSFKRHEDRLAAESFDRAFAATSVETLSDELSKKDGNSYQFVGVINKPSDKKPITWYARKKPQGARWSVRLVHVNRDAIVKDLFNRGKVDVFAKYGNTGKVDEETGQRIVKSDYAVRERSWRNFWNLSPKHFFSDSSGMYWRERRLRSGLYTDGANVYEATYRYGDGRNGMRPVSPFNSFMKSKAVDPSTKDRIQKRLNKDDPDIVLEE